MTPAKRMRLELLPFAQARFGALREAGESYDDREEARTLVRKNWKKFRRFGFESCVALVVDWFGELARDAFEELQEPLPGTAERRVPAVVIHYADGGKGKRRRSIKGAVLAELRSYLGILDVNAIGAVRQRDLVRLLVARCDALGCGEDEEVWPYLSDEPRLPLRPAAEAPHPEMSPGA